MKRRALIVLLLLPLATLLLAGCGKSSPTEPEPPQAPTGETQTLTGSVEAYGTSSHGVEIFRAGKFTVMLTWSGSADLDLYLTPVECTSYPPDACLIYARSAASVGNQETIEWTAAAGERFRVWVDNFSPTTPATYTIVAAVRP